ncbi:TolC family protein [Leptolyngbya sp. FACHB-261]|uniref:TolC family protein n=1 Tax=Leptolyngbya sp. FACHB-261 TaxID=2692806 RepID=UPI0016862E5D|nr:TolC family protein [Leptolyngbya sp. FACHB-261]MBD2101410.1 TolC family protein [Leptolyngbya sp. FACHB-261]
MKTSRRLIYLGAATVLPLTIPTLVKAEIKAETQPVPSNFADFELANSSAANSEPNREEKALDSSASRCPTSAASNAGPAPRSNAGQATPPTISHLAADLLPISSSSVSQPPCPSPTSQVQASARPTQARSTQARPTQARPSQTQAAQTQAAQVSAPSQLRPQRPARLQMTPSISASPAPVQATQPTQPSNPSPKPQALTLQPPTPENQDEPFLLAQTTSDVQAGLAAVQSITLTEALALATQNNRDLMQAKLAVEDARARVREVRAALYPRLSAEASLTATNPYLENHIQRRRVLTSVPAVIPTTQGNLPLVLNMATTVQKVKTSSSDDINTNLGSSLSINYDLFTGGARTANIRISEEQLRIAQLNYDRLLQQVRLDISNAYYDIQQANEQIRIAQEPVRSAQQSLRDAQALHQTRGGSQFDVLRARVRLANAQQELIQAQAQQLVSRRNLAQLLNLSQSLNPTPADPVQMAGDWQLSLEESILKAFANRPELEQQRIEAQIGDEREKLAKAQLSPQVSLFGTYSILNQLNQSYGFTDGFAVGAKVRWELFNGFATQARVQQAQLDRQMAENLFAQARDQIRYSVERSYIVLQSRRQQLRTAQITLEQAQESLRLARERFKARLSTQLDVINAEQELTRAESIRTQAILGYNRAFIALQRAVSNL